MNDQLRMTNGTLAGEPAGSECCLSLGAALVILNSGFSPFEATRRMERAAGARSFSWRTN